MTDHTELVKRLRELWPGHPAITNEAADAIDALMKERDALQICLGKMLDAWGGYPTPDVDEAIGVMQDQGRDYWSMQGYVDRNIARRDGAAKMQQVAAAICMAKQQTWVDGKMTGETIMPYETEVSRRIRAISIEDVLK